MKTFTIAKYTIIRTFRDFKSLSLMVLFPIVLILILGSALNSAFKVKDLEPFTIAYINNDNGQISKNFDSFFANKEIKKIIKINRNINNSQAQKLLKKDKLVAIIQIDKDYSQNLFAGKKSTINVIAKEGSSFNIQILKNIVNSFNSVANSHLASSNINREIANNKNLKITNFLNNKPLSGDGKIPNSIGYYAVTMLVLIIMYGSQYAIYDISTDYLEGLKGRMLSTPVSLFTHFSGKIIGIFISIFMQSAIVIIFTKYALKANWGQHFGQLIFIIITLSILVTALGVMLTMIFKNSTVAGSFVQIFIPIMTFVSGGYMKINIDNDFFNKIRFLLPSTLGQTAFFNTIYGKFSPQYASALGLMWIYVFIFILIAYFFGRRKLA